MARIRRPEPIAATGPAALVPPWLQVGPCVEVFAEAGEAGGPLLSAFGRHGVALNAWTAAMGLDGHGAARLLCACAPWSVEDPGGVERLARHGLTPSDLPNLRRAASEWITSPREHYYQ